MSYPISALLDPLPLLGAQLEGAIGTRDKWLVPNRVYHFPLLWDECEKAPGVYTFPEEAFYNVTRLNMKLGSDYRLIIGTRTCPYFYALRSDRGSPPKPENYIALAKLIEQIYNTFHPWGVELWNEPEFNEAEAAGMGKYYGAWGNAGLSYGTMVTEVYDYLRYRTPGMSVIAGASFGLLDTTRSLAFLRGATSGGMRADYWSWHGYLWYRDVVNDTRAFENILRFSQDAYDIFPQLQILSETSVMRKTELDDPPLFQQRQAELLQYLIDTTYDTEIESVIWYTLADNGWRHSDLIRNSIEMPVYNVWKDYQE